MFKFFQDRPIIFLAPIIAYFLGWIYLTDYFHTLSVPRRDLELNVYDVYLFAFSPFLSMAQDCSLWGWLFVLGLGVFGWAYATQKENDKVQRKLATLFSLVAVVALTYMFGSERGRADANEMLRGCGGRLVIATFENQAEIDNALLVTANRESRLRFVWQTDDYLYVLPVTYAGKCQAQSEYQDMIARGMAWPTYQINRADVNYLTLLDPSVRG